MDGLVTGHVIAIAFWAGLVAVEVLFEAAGVSGKIDVRSAALLHRWTDRYLEPRWLVVRGPVTLGQ